MANAFKSLPSGGFEPAPLGIRGLPYTNELWWHLTENEKILLLSNFS